MVQMTLPALKPTGFESDYDDLQAQIKRRRLQAAALANQDLGLGAQMVSGHLVGGGWLEALGKVAQSGIGSYNQKLLDEEEQALNKQKQDEFSQLAAKFPRTTPGKAAVPATEGLGPTGFAPEAGTPEAGAPALLPKKPEPGDFINFASQLARFGPMGQAAAQHIFGKVIDTEMAVNKPPEWIHVGSTTNAKGEPVPFWADKHDPDRVKVGDTVIYKDDEFKRKVAAQEEALRLDPQYKGVADADIRRTALNLQLHAYAVSPPNAAGVVGVANVPRLMNPGPAEPPVPQQTPPQPQPAPAPPPAAPPQPPMQSSEPLAGEEGPPPPMIPQPPGQAATPPLMPQPYKTNFTGTADQVARMNALAKADAEREAAKAAVGKTPVPAPAAAPAPVNKPVSAMTDQELWARYGGERQNHPFMPPKGDPNVKLFGGTPGVEQAKAMNTAFQQIREQRDKRAVDGMEGVLENIDAVVEGLIAANPNIGIRRNPKTGDWEGAAPGANIGKLVPIKGEPAKLLQQAAQEAYNIKYKAESGTAVSASEEGRQLVALGNSILNSDDKNFWAGLANMRRQNKRAQQEIINAQPPIVRDAWRQNALRSQYGG